MGFLSWWQGLSTRTRGILAAVTVGILALAAAFARGRRSGKAQAEAGESRARADQVAQDVAAAAKRGDDGAVQRMLEDEVRKARQRRGGR